MFPYYNCSMTTLETPFTNCCQLDWETGYFQIQLGMSAAGRSIRPTQNYTSTTHANTMKRWTVYGQQAVVENFQVYQSCLAATKYS